MDIMPELIQDFKKSWLFGLVSISFVLEDRRPDLEVFDFKYKYMLTFRVYSTEYAWIWFSSYLFKEYPLITRYSIDFFFYR